VIARRHGDDDGVDLRVFDGGRVVGVGAGAAVVAAEGVRLRAIAARVATRDLAAQRSEVLAMDASNKAAAEEGDS